MSYRVGSDLLDFIFYFELPVLFILNQQERNEE